jgi:hypothetical protein
MALKIRSMKDFSAGLMFMGIGGLFAIGANQYPMGTAVRMGPAYFPSILGWATVALGLFVFVESFFAEDEAPTPTAWRPLIMVIGSVCAFAALINTGGLITATVVLIIVSALGGHEFKWKEAIISAVLMSVTVWAIFDKALGLPFKLFPWS